MNTVEDPKRMRTKLRLDLKDVRRQIEDLEDLLKSDKSPENVEAHRKLVEYEKKLKDQYEKMTGLSLDQASNLESKNIRVADKQYKKSTFSGFLALIGAYLFAWGFYNTVLHSIVGFAPTDLLDYFMGTGQSVASANVFAASMTYPESLYLIDGPLVGGAVLVLLSGLFDSSRSKLSSLLEGLGLISVGGYFSYILYTSPGDQHAAEVVKLIIDNLMYISISILVGGVLLFLGALSHKSFFRKLLGIICSGLVLFAGAMYFMLSSASDASSRLVSVWPWYTGAIVVAIGIYGFIGLLRMLK